MLDLSTTLKHYKRQDIREEIISTCKDREIGTRYGSNGFGKRPDVLLNPADILELAKQGVTSFHVSEEHWINPMHLSTDLKRSEIDELRTGWDLVLDVDCPIWEYSKLITQLLINALHMHGIKHVSCKFSGNKGFHVAVPFDVFPKEIADGDKIYPIRLWFPDGPKKVVLYLMNYIDSKANDFELSRKVLKMHSLQEISRNLGKSIKDISADVCLDCEHLILAEDSSKDKRSRSSPVAEKKIFCPNCQSTIQDSKDEDFIKCQKCKSVFSRNDLPDSNNIHKPKTEKDSNKCPRCGSRKIISRLNPNTLIDVDTVLISSRHLYRSVYSLHEKSALASVPIDPEKVLTFDKASASPANLAISKQKFLSAPQKHIDEASALFLKAIQWHSEMEHRKKEDEHFSSSIYTSESSSNKEFIQFEEKVPVELFPPCILQILLGLEDGKKRALFILLNFLSNVGWSHDEMKELLLEWNKKNPEPMRDNIIIGHLRYHKANKKSVLPPNCSNKSYYQDFHICHPDNLCSKIKNPVNYTRRKAFSILRKSKNNANKSGSADAKPQDLLKNPGL